MKKTLIALAVAASAVVSGSAMAAGWQENSASGEVNFGGQINANSQVTWMWLIGEGKSDFVHKTQDLTNNNQTLTITADNDIPILAGKLKNGVAGSDFSIANTFPSISFLSSGTAVTPEFNTNGALALTVKAFDDQGAEFGTLKINGRAAGSVALATPAPNTTYKTYGAGVPGTDGIFSGGLANNGTLLVWSGLATTKVVEKFGGPALAELEDQVRDVTSDSSAVFNDVNNVWGISRSNNEDMNMRAYSLSYGFGVEQGATLELNFTKPVTTTTVWKAPLTVQISYN